MFRRLSRKMSGSGGKKNLRQIEGGSHDEMMRSHQQEVMKYEAKLAEMNNNREIEPTTRHGTQLFHVKDSTGQNVQNDLDRVLYEMPMPENVDAMTDLMKLHKEGDKFPYVGIVGNEGETLDARRARMLSLKPTLGLRNIPEIEVIGCQLVDVEGEFSMSTLMEFAVKMSDQDPNQGGLKPKSSSNMRNFSISKQYVHIKSVTGLYTPNMSSTSDFCKLWFFLIDNRLVNQQKSGQSNALVSNQEGVMEMSCDYCVSVRDLNHFTLGYTLEREILKQGFQWGTISFYFNIVESDIPYQSVKRDALAVYRMPISTLLERNTSADKSDISFTASDVGALRNLYKNGDIVDVDEPQKSRLKKSSYSKSTIRGTTKGEEISGNNSGEWGFMKGSRKPMMDAGIASVDMEDESEDEMPITKPQAKADWEAHQEKLREMQKGEGKIFVEEGNDQRNEVGFPRIEEEVESDPEIFRKMDNRNLKNVKKNVGFQVHDV